MKRIFLALAMIFFTLTFAAAATKPIIHHPAHIVHKYGLPVQGTFSASIAGFTPASAYATPLAVSTTSARTPLPSGTVMVIYNTGSNVAYVQLGNSGVTATASNDAIQPGSWMAFTAGANAYLAAITTTSTTSLNISGGAGLPTGSGGGSSGGGGGGTVTQATAANLNATVVGTGTFAVQAAENGTWNITNISGTISLPTGASTSALQPTNATLGSTTSGQTGNLDLGAVTTAAPTYTTGQTNALSLNTAGGLRVDGSGVTQPISATSLPLPTGAATSVNQSTEITSLGTIATNSGTQATAANQTTGNGSLATIATNSATQATAANQTTGNGSLATIATNSGTQATAANQTTIITDITRSQGVIGAATAPADMTLGGVVYNSTPLTLTNGQSSALQGDANGYLEVNIKAGAGSGGTALADNAAFTQSTTSETPFGCLANSGAQTNATAGHATVVACTLAGSVHTTVDNTIGAITPGDGITTGTYASGSPVIGVGMLWNGTTYDRAKSAGATGVAAVGGAAAAGAAPSGNPVPAAALGGGATGGLLNTLVQADSSVPINVSTATTTQLVALSSGRKIYVMAADVIAGGTGNITFEYGTGTNCGTGTTTLTGAYPLTAQAGLTKGTGLGPLWFIPAGNALCVLTSAGVQMSGSVSYAQF